MIRWKVKIGLKFILIFVNGLLCMCFLSFRLNKIDKKKKFSKMFLVVKDLCLGENYFGVINFKLF